ncbi:MAG: PIN domain-containing protein [Holophagales bacterium]|nr:PIN domain-containing protein [Holophagales bacterium]
MIGELYEGALRSGARERHLTNTESRALPRLTILPYDTRLARIYGRICAELEERGLCLADADLQIAATTIRHDLVLVTGNLRHSRQIPGPEVCTVSADARGRRGRAESG